MALFFKLLGWNLRSRYLDARLLYLDPRSICLCSIEFCRRTILIHLSGMHHHVYQILFGVHVFVLQAVVPFGLDLCKPPNPKLFQCPRQTKPHLNIYVYKCYGAVHRDKWSRRYVEDRAVHPLRPRINALSKYREPGDYNVYSLLQTI